MAFKRNSERSATSNRLRGRQKAQKTTQGPTPLRGAALRAGGALCGQSGPEGFQVIENTFLQGTGRRTVFRTQNNAKSAKNGGFSPKSTALQGIRK